MTRLARQTRRHGHRDGPSGGGGGGKVEPVAVTKDAIDFVDLRVRRSGGVPASLGGLGPDDIRMTVPAAILALPGRLCATTYGRASRSLNRERLPNTSEKWCACPSVCETPDSRVSSGGEGGGEQRRKIERSRGRKTGSNVKDEGKKG